MPNNEIADYIKSELAKGESRQEITNSLLEAGWKSDAVQDAFRAFPVPTPSANAPAPSAETPSHPSGKVITEKDYPVTKLWVFKEPIIIAVIIIGLAFFGYFSFYLILAIIIYLLVVPIMKANFHYSLDDKYLRVRQGFIAKKQRNLPYGVIQNVFVRQDLFDRVFGLASLNIENASQAGGGNKLPWWYGVNGSSGTSIFGQAASLGSSGNKIGIPGLKKQNAETLKNIILQKMKENPVEEFGL